MFQKTNEVHEYRTRQAKNDFLPPKPKTNYLKKAFSYRGAVAWNNLPSEIKNSETKYFQSKTQDYQLRFHFNIVSICYI